LFNSIYIIRFKKLYKNGLTTKSKELLVDLFKGHASRPYTIGIYLLETSCRIISSDARLPIFPNIALEGLFGYIQ